MSWCIDTNLRTVTVGDVGGSHLLPHDPFPRQSDTVHGFSRVISISQRFSPSRTSFAHTNTIESTCRHVKAFLIPNNRIRGLRPSIRPEHICGGVPIRQRGPVQDVHRNRWNQMTCGCNLGLKNRSSRAPHLPAISVMSLRNSLSSHSKLQSSHRLQHVSLCLAHHHA